MSSSACKSHRSSSQQSRSATKLSMKDWLLIFCKGAIVYVFGFLAARSVILITTRAMRRMYEGKDIVSIDTDSVNVCRHSGDCNEKCP